MGDIIILKIQIIIDFDFVYWVCELVKPIIIESLFMQCLNVKI